MLEWKTPELNDREWVQRIIENSNCLGSDTSYVNIYLLRNKYNLKISRYEGFIIRYYNGAYGRQGYTFPIGNGDVKDALKEIAADAQTHNRELKFCFVTEEQKDILLETFPDILKCDKNDGDSDYVYSQKDLSMLSGKKFHKKKNHVSKFMKSYDNIVSMTLTDDNVSDALKVEEEWYAQHEESIDDSSIEERRCIHEAIKNFNELGLFGLIIYVDNKPAAMTIASKITKDTVDVHFEKVLNEYAANGGYSAVNQMFAKTLESYQWINREEDVGIEGLRKAKLSYRPQIILGKYRIGE